MKINKKYVTFYSPGTFFPEESCKEVESFDLKEICKLASTILERHNAKPHSFRLTEYEEGKIISDGEEYKNEPKKLFSSGLYYITGQIMTLDSIPDTEEFSILRFNMNANDIRAVIENNNSWRFTGAFTKEDFLIDWEGNILDKGENYYGGE